METVYIETTVVSYLVATPSRDVLIAGQQQATRDWRQRQRGAFRCITSDETIAEASRGDVTQADLRLTALHGLPRVAITPKAEALAGEFLASGALPPTARSDALHLALAALVETDYLLTWNCRHLANAQILRRLDREAVRRGWNLPTVCTPLELMGEGADASEPNP